MLLAFMSPDDSSNGQGRHRVENTRGETPRTFRDENGAVIINTIQRFLAHKPVLVMCLLLGMVGLHYFRMCVFQAALN